LTLFSAKKINKWVARTENKKLLAR